MDDLAGVLNPFLFSLGISHTKLVTNTDPDFTMLRTVGWRRIEEPRVFQIGAHFLPSAEGWVIRAVWNDGPAERAGLRRGDRVLAADGAPFHPIKSFRTGKPAVLEVRRNGRKQRFRAEPVFEAAHYSLFHATRASARILDVDERRVGYVHLWSCTSPRILQEFTRIVREEFEGVDGIVLDLRDGYGGYWFDYLDPFFPDRAGYVSYVGTTRSGKRTVVSPDTIPPHACFEGPMVVLVNEGTRSGKEAVAYQFRKSGRGLLVGATTAGYFAGGDVTRDPENRYLLYLAVTGLLLDGRLIEGIGVSPDVAVEYPLDRSLDEDPQLARGLLEMRRLLSAVPDKDRARPGGPPAGR
jgi:carboxyl-terminal processing protease